MDTKNLPSALVIAASLVVCGIMLPVAVKEFRAADRVVSVKGLCEREVKADKVIWPIRFKLAGDNLNELYSELQAKCLIVEGFLKNGGIDASCISRSIPAISDKDTQEYGGNDRTYRYVATISVTVCTSDVDRVISLMGDQNTLVASGIAIENSWDTQPQFLFEGLNNLKPEMIQEATENARAVAGKFASDSESRLGKIKTASQGTFSIEDRDSFTPQIKNVRIVTYVDYYLVN